MQELLFLVHRIPYPPDKGDKIRSWNFFAHLAQRFRVHLGCFIDDPRDWEFTEKLRQMCADCCFIGQKPRTQRLMSLRGLVDGRALTLPYYASTELRQWVARVVARPSLSHLFIYCSAMAQYVEPAVQRRLRSIADIVDIDSEKWADYATRKTFPMRWLYAREARALRAVEIDIAHRFDKTVVATPAELALLQQFAPAERAKLLCITNGVDSDYFAPDRDYANPYAPGVPMVAFVGAMDYWPNVDAAIHFARAIFPAVKARVPGMRLAIVGSNPTPDVMALGTEPDIMVTGRVPDVRSYIAHATAVVAPLRIARGVQNKVLEGMAMAKAVVASPEALNGISAEIGREVLCASSAAEFADSIARIATSDAGQTIGARARRRVLAHYSWSASLNQLDRALDDDHADRVDAAASNASPR